VAPNKNASGSVRVNWCQYNADPARVDLNRVGCSRASTPPRPTSTLAEVKEEMNDEPRLG
jgi:hypothetical protein